MNANNGYVQLLGSIRGLLRMILAVFLLRIGLDYTPLGKTATGGIIGLVSLYVGIAIFLWIGVSGFLSLFSRVAGSSSNADAGNNSAEEVGGMNPQ